MSPKTCLLSLLALSLAFAPSPAAAQSIGTFRWQLAPYCNVVTAVVTQMGAVYRLDGSDNQCDVGNVAAMSGEAQLNGTGGVTLGLTIVTSPSGRPVHVSASITLPSASGVWTDSAGGTGQFVLLAGAPAAGSPRPVPAVPLMFGGSVDGGTTPSARGLRIGMDGTGVLQDGAALEGLFGAPSGFISVGNAGVRGQSGADTGVMGLSGSGSGVIGQSYTGVGVNAFSADGTAVVAWNGAGGTALELVNGSIRVSGASRAAFRHASTVSNVSGNLTRIDHPQTNLDPDAMLFVTHVFAAGATVYTPALGVYYDNVSGKWTIFNEDLSAMSPGALFNVLVVKQ